MSWFRRKPKLKEQTKHVSHYRTSPLAEKYLKEAVRKQSEKPKDSKDKE